MADEDLIAWEMLYGGSGEPPADWQPPADWLEVPEPDDYEINLLFNIYEVGDESNNLGKLLIEVSDPKDMVSGKGFISVEWGDGNTDQYTGRENGQSWAGYLEHDYTETGQYVVKITTTEQSCFLQFISEARTLLIAKLGNKIIVNNGISYSGQNAFKSHSALCWIKFNGTGGLPVQSGFVDCVALKRIDMSVPPEIIPYGTFSNTNYSGKFDFSKVVKIEQRGLYYTAFKKLDLPKCVEIGQYGVYNNHLLEEISAPLCTSVGNNGFAGCYKITKAEFADDCTFGTNCFQNCYSLYPRPDGSTN